MLVTPTLFLLGLGLGAAVILSIASKVFYLWEDPKIAEVEDSLLGANCGGCGFPGCSAAAGAVVAGKVGADVCIAGGMEIALKVAAVMGMEVEVKEPEIAYSSCSYSIIEADSRFSYAGVGDCRAAALYAGGPKECPIGCLGLGTCVQSCPFGAIKMGSHGLPVFIREKCRGCGVCVEVCPKDIIYLTSTTYRMMGDYRTDECTTPCMRSCPTGIDIPRYIKEISLNNYEEAVRIIKERNPLPSIVGRICPAPCEKECRRNINDESVAINNLKRFVADYEMKNNRRVHPFRAPGTDMKVAVVGGGVQGLTTAYYLACLGHQPTIFESLDRLGGIIRNVIAKSRLPENIIDWDVEGILDAGVAVETKKSIGKDFTINSLLSEGYRAVALSTGGIDSRKILRGNDEEEFDQVIPGVYSLLDFLISSSKGEKLNVGNTVYILGGGKSTLQAAAQCKKGGAKKVTILYPYGRDDMTSRGIDVAAAESEGIAFRFCTVVSGLNGKGEKLVSISLSAPETDPEDATLDTLIVATGRLSDMVFIRPDGEDADEKSELWKTIETYRMFPDSAGEDLFNFAENSIMNDNLAVIKSIGRGRRIARAILLFLSDKDIESQYLMIRKGMNILNTEDVHNVNDIKRNIMPRNDMISSFCDTDLLFSTSELEQGYSEEVAVAEAERCLQCGLICYKKAI